MSSFTTRMIRAARLDITLYEEVEADKTALGQAMGVVVLSGVAAGIGSMGSTGLSGIITGTFAALIGWFIWAYITYIVGTKILPQPQTRADYGQLLRTIGFSSSPGLIRVFAVIPVLSGIIILVSSIWMLIAMIIAVRQALDFTSTMRAVGVCIIGWILQMITWILFLSTFGGVFTSS